MVGRKRGRGGGRQAEVKAGMEEREGTLRGRTGRMDGGREEGTVGMKGDGVRE